MLCIHHTTLEDPAYQPINKRTRAQGSTRNARKHAYGNATTTVSPQSPVTQVQHNGPVRLSEHIKWNEIVVRSPNIDGVQLTDCVRDEFDSQQKINKSKKSKSKIPPPQKKKHRKIKKRPPRVPVETAQTNCFLKKCYKKSCSN